MNFIIIVISFTCCITSVSVSWTHLQSIVASGDLAQLSRSQENLQRYLELKDSLKEQAITMPDYVKQKIFGYRGQPKHQICLVESLTIAEASISVYFAGPQAAWRQFIHQKIQCSPTQGISQRSHFVLLAANDFPYELELINHWVIWSSSQLPPTTIQALLTHILNETVETLNFENPQEIKSIPEISHYQLFWKKKNDPLNDL